MRRALRSLPFAAAALVLATIAILIWNRSDDRPLVDPSRTTPDQEAAAAASLAGSDPAPPRDRVTEADPATGPYRAPVGTELTFAGSLRTTVHLTAPTGDAQDLRYAVAGAFRVVVADRRPGSLVAHVSWRDADVELSDAVEADPLEDEIRAALADGAFVWMDDDGTTRGYRFVAERFDHRGWLRSAVDAMRYVVPDLEAETWTADECDVSGPTQMSYRVTEVDGGDRVIHKRKLGVEQPENEDVAITVDASGAGEGRFAAELGWIDRSQYSESNRSTVPDVGRFEQQLDAELRLEASRLLSTTELGALPAFDWDGPWEPAHGLDDAAAMGEDAERERWRRELEGVEVRSLIAALHELEPEGEGRLDVFTKLLWKLRLDPGALAELQAAIELGQLDELSLETALAAIGYAGTPAGESLLASLAGDDGRNPFLRQIALQSLFHLAAPSASSDAVAIRLALDPATSQELRDTGALLIGALAHAATAPRRASLVDALRELERDARDRDDITTWLQAVGNAGAAELVGPVLSELTHESPWIREAAVDALRRVDTEDATTALLDRLRNDEQTGVRLRAAEVLGDRYSQQVRDALVDRLANDANEGVRRLALMLLGDRLEDTVARDAIERAAGADRSQEVRELAAQVLAGR